MLSPTAAPRQSRSACPGVPQLPFLVWAVHVRSDSLGVGSPVPVTQAARHLLVRRRGHDRQSGRQGRLARPKRSDSHSSNRPHVRHDDAMKTARARLVDHGMRFRISSGSGHAITADSAANGPAPWTHLRGARDNRVKVWR